MSLEFRAKHGLITTENIIASGSLTIYNGITSSLGAFTTASWAISASNIIGGIGQTTIITGSLIPITSSFAQTASQAISASWAPGGSGTTLATGSLVPITSSWAQTSSQAISASWSPGGSAPTYTSSLFGTASWAINTFGMPTVVVTSPRYNADPTFTKDSTVAIQNAINDLTGSFIPPGGSTGGVVFIPAGTYKITGSINIYSAVSIVGETSYNDANGGTRLYGGSTNISMFNISSSGNQFASSFRYLNLNGGDSLNGTGINVLSSSFIDIETCTFKKFLIGANVLHSTDTKINNSTFVNNSSSIIFDNLCYQFLISNCVINSCNIAISGSGLTSNNLGADIRNNDIESNVYGIILGPNNSGCSIQNNLFASNTSDIIISGSIKSSIIKNTFVGGSISNIQLSSSQYATIANNYFANPVIGLVLQNNSYIQRYGNYYPSFPYSITESNSTFAFINDGITSSFTNLIQGTASWAQTASQAISASWSPGGSAPTYTSSLFGTSSWAFNVVNNQTTFNYLTDTTSSTNWITTSFNNSNQIINLPITASYNFTQSNIPLVGQVSDILLYISHSAPSGTSSLSFPSSWKNIGGGWPTSLISNTIALLWLRAIDTSSIIGTFNYSGSQPSASYAITASFALNAGSGGSLITGSLIPITSSFAQTASQAISASWSPGGSAPTYTSSLFGTASWAQSSSYDAFIAVGYLLNTTSSTNWITTSFSSPNQQINLVNSALYSFTQSNPPSVGQVSDVLMYINHTAVASSSLSFPNSWQNIGGGWPKSLIPNTVAVLWLRAIDTSNVIGTFNYSGSQPSASYSITSATSSISNILITNNLTASTPPYSPGVLYYDTSSYGFRYYDDNSSDSVLIGRETRFRAFNASNNYISNSCAVYISGSNGNYASVYLAIADGTNTKANVAGVATVDIPINSFGYVCISGRVDVITSTNPRFNFPVGPLYLSTTISGSYQSTLPTASSEKVFVGYCVLSSSIGSAMIVDTNPFAYGSATASLANTASQAITASFAQTSSNGARSWGFVTYNGTTIVSNTYNATISRGAIGSWNVLFQNAFNNSIYAPISNGWSGSQNSQPTASIISCTKQTNSGFTMSIVKMMLTGSVPPAAASDFSTCSFSVFSY